jgi:hypothetical protein
MSAAGYWSGPWTGEDAGPDRASIAHDVAALDVRRGALRATSRLAFLANMVIVRGADEVYAQGCSDPTPASTGWLERIDPVTLEPVARTPDLPGGPWWAGGAAAHANGSLYVVHGRHAHRCNTDCEVLAARELPQPRPYNSFVIVPDGHLVTKDIDLDARTPTRLCVLDPETLALVHDEIEVPEPSIGRLSAAGDNVYVVGTHTVFRYVWNGTKLEHDDSWSVRYRTDADQSYGWDPVVRAGALWWMDNGDGATGAAGTGSMRGVGVAAGPVHLYMAALGDQNDVQRVEVCGQPHGFICNPPLVDETRDIAVAFDASNGVVAAFDGTTLAPRWSRALDHAGHMLLWPQSGELLVQDHTDIVVLDVVNGNELARVATDSVVQYFLFPAAGTRRDAYVCSASTITRVFVEA